MRKQVSFPRVMKCTALVTLIVTAILALINHFFPREWLTAIAISTGTTFYHFAMRLTVGTIVPKLMPHPRRHKWFLQRSFEPKLYKLLRVKQWKDHMPTYDPAAFSMRNNSLEQIVHNSCVSEAVHEMIVLFSLLPILFTFLWGALPVFLITSMLAAAFDSCVVMMQRYNRPRLLRILSKKEAQSL